MHGQLWCDHALVPRQISPWAILTNQWFLTNFQEDGTKQPGRVAIYEWEISNSTPPLPGNYKLWEPTRNWCPNRNTRFPLHLKLRWRPDRAAAPSNLAPNNIAKSNIELAIGGASSRLRQDASSASGLVGWVGLWGFLWWAPSAKRKDHHGVSSGWSSVWHRSNTGLSSSQYEQIPIILRVWPFWLTPFFFRSITFWRAYG